MPEIVGVRLKRTGKVQYFDSNGILLRPNDAVVVETPRGLEIGRVVIAPEQIAAEELEQPLKPIVRKAEEADLKKMEEWRAKERDCIVKCREYVEKYHLPMKLLGCEYNLDGSRLTFYFSAQGRVDFRELVKELASVFKTKVELRQMGPRDEAKMLGGIGRCGRLLCCTTYLCEFDPVSIKMAKEQDLPLNPMKISGLCGRLLCCLAYESEQYQEMKAKMPEAGQKVMTPLGQGTVVWANPLKETVVVEFETEAMTEFPLSQLTLEEATRKAARGRARKKATEKENSSSSDASSDNG
jgi:cell fate regulator YaaT (PSP1 superfamily)